MNRKTFLQATLATSLAGLVACSGEGEDPAGGDGDMGSGGTGTGGDTLGAGGSDVGAGGSDVGAGGSDVGTGGNDVGAGGSDVGTGGNDVGAGGSDVGTGGNDAGAGGSDAGSGGAGTGGEAGSACATVMSEWVDNHQQGAHAFMMEVSVADVEAGVEKVYNVQGASQHPHTLTVSAQNFADLATNGMIELRTSEDFGHDHTIILTCGM